MAMTPTELGGAFRTRKSLSRWLTFSWTLRTKLLLITLVLLAAICGALGVLGYAAMNVVLTQQLDGQLQEASNRTIEHGDPTPLQSAQPNENPMNVPAQGAGTLSAYRDDGEAFYSGLFSVSGQHQELSAADLEMVNDLPESSEPVERSLSVGHYRLIAVDDGEGHILITGLPTAAVVGALNSLATTMAATSLAGLTLTGISAAIVIRRTLRPLDHLSKIATRVAELPLEAGEVVLTVRVAPGAPHTEVGNVAQAFNKMLDNVASALAARQRSETQVRQFVADASHELRTPLAAIRGHSELIRMTEPLSPNGYASLSRVESESLRMAALVEDLSLLARLDEGQPNLQGDVDLTELVIESVSDIRVTAPEQHWSISLPDDPVIVQGNEDYLRQVLMNLLTNAHKHTDSGTSVVTSLLVENNDGVVTVTDDGPGIPPNFLDHVFSRFTRADEARTGGHGTSGLGLSIVQAIVAAHHGSVLVDSKPGKTTFTLRLPTRTNHMIPLTPQPTSKSIALFEVE